MNPDNCIFCQQPTQTVPAPLRKICNQNDHTYIFIWKAQATVLVIDNNTLGHSKILGCHFNKQKIPEFPIEELVSTFYKYYNLRAFI